MGAVADPAPDQAPPRCLLPLLTASGDSLLGLSDYHSFVQSELKVSSNGTGRHLPAYSEATVAAALRRARSGAHYVVVEEFELLPSVSGEEPRAARTVASSSTPLGTMVDAPSVVTTVLTLPVPLTSPLICPSVIVCPG
jgi:hypothetical protein